MTMEFLDQQNDCRFPCWLGNVPGETEWAAVDQFYKSLGPAVECDDNDARIGRYRITFETPERNLSLTQIYRVREDKVFMIWASLRPLSTTAAVPALLQRQSLPQVLGEYGKPDQVYVHTYASVPEGVIPLRLLLFYSQGMLLSYGGGIEPDGDRLRGCLHPLDGVALWLWDSTEVWTLETISKSGPNLPPDFVKEVHTLEEATGMTVETFFETYRLSADPVCLETSRALW